MSKIEALTAAYAQLRRKKQEMTREFDEKIRAVNTAVADVEEKLRGEMNRLDVEQVRNDHGLFSRKTKRRYFAEDWARYYEHIHATGNFDLLQKRIGEGALKEEIQEADGKLPPGISFKDFVEINFTKPKA